MEINDIVYGYERVEEQELFELINSKPVQRLKGISNFGMPDEYYHKKGFSRYEHSIGVMILLRRLNAGLEEQVAGLLHDVSHTAFSHAIDSVLGNPLKEDYQDKTLLGVLEKTGIKKFLEKQGFDYKRIANLKNFSLLEHPAPYLCADRIDYTLREIASLHSQKDAKKIFNHLINFNGKIIFNSQEYAKLFSSYYVQLQREHWGGDESKARYYILSNVLKHAINKKIISIDDLMLTDMKVLNILNDSNDKEITNGLELLRKGFSLAKTNNGKGVLFLKKFRYINPEILYLDRIVLLSEILPSYSDILNNERQNYEIKQKFEIIP